MIKNASTKAAERQHHKWREAVTLGPNTITAMIMGNEKGSADIMDYKYQRHVDTKKETSQCSWHDYLFFKRNP